MKDFKIKSILMPTDFSELSERALRTAIAICKRHKAKLTLLNVIDVFLFSSSNDILMPYYYQANETVIKTIEENLNKLAKKFSSQSHLKIDAIVVKGNPADIICRIAEEEKHDMIVMGTHGASGIRNLFIGSNAFRVIKYAPCPVLTIPGKWDKTEFKKVVFPIRLIPGAIDKYNYARTIIQKNNSNLLIIGLLDNELPETLAEFKKQTDKLKIKLYKDKIEFSTIIYQTQNFPEKVLNASKGNASDLIIITSSLDSEWKTIFIGPYTQQIVNHAKCPVLSIKADLDVTELLKISEMQIETASKSFRI
jgi:nucleotide-binding universal stress UspA family protein